jgi:2-amino-4-hydroxy-6-hydroxymethyldihydropteridine diphosphokinase
MVDAFVAVGSNIRPEEHTERALEALQRRVRVTATSTFHRTEAVGRPEQPAFVNGVWKIQSEHTPRSLKFDVLRPIEQALGRVRTADRFAPRPIDLDLVLHGDTVVDEPDLRLPDPDIRLRAFLALPLLELAPSLVLPDTGEPLAAVAARWTTPAGTADLEPMLALTRRLKERIRWGQETPG